MVLQSLRKNPSRTEDAATPKHSPRDDRARASRGESNRRGWLFIALGGILLLVTLTQYWYDKLSGHVTHKDRGMQVKNLKESLKEAVESSRFDLFVPVPGKAPAAYTPTTPASLSPARTLKWESDDSTRAAVEGVVPTVLLDSPAARWTLRWLDLWGAAVQFPLLVGVAENQITANRGMEMPDMAPAMVMQNERDGYGGMLSDFTVAHTPPAGVREEVLFIDFLRTFRDRAVRMVFSYNYRIFEAMLQITGFSTWRDFIIVERVISDMEKKRENSTPFASSIVSQAAPNVWMMHPGTVLQARMSPYHTFRAQMQGIARAVLFSPQTVEKYAYLYPHIHVSHSQSQVPLEGFDANVFPLAKRLEGVEVKELAPGQVLYIPPYWMVRWESSSGGMGLDVLSPSEPQLHLLEASGQGVPIAQAEVADPGGQDRIVAAQVFLVHVMSRMPDSVVASPQSFASYVYQQRYEPLFPLDGLYMREKRRTFTCFQDQPEILATLIQKLDRDGVAKAAERVADSANDPGVTDSERRLWLADYTETVARWAMQSPEDAVLFITQCLSFESKIVITEEVEGPSVLRFRGGEEL